MTDERYTFIETVKERRNIKNSANKKPVRSGCRLSTDYKSKKELDKMNGECISYNLNKRMMIDEFNRLPEDIQKEYIINIYKNYEVTWEDIYKMLGTSSATFYRVLKNLNIKHRFIEKKDHKSFNNFGRDQSPLPLEVFDSEPKEEIHPFRYNFTQVVIESEASSWDELYAQLRDTPFPTKQITINLLGGSEHA